jgi:hypothetical protein
MNSCFNSLIPLCRQSGNANASGTAFRRSLGLMIECAGSSPDQESRGREGIFRQDRNYIATFVAAFLCWFSMFSQNWLISQTAAAGEVKWWHKMMGATNKIQRKLNKGNGVTVGVLDGLAIGVDSTGSVIYLHPELNGRYVGDYGWPRAAGDWTNYSTIGDKHGTHVAGIVSANKGNGGMRGIAPKASIYSVGVFDRNGFVGDTNVGMDQTVSAGGSIVNMSYGIAGGIIGSLADINAIIAHNNNLFVAKAAGNDGTKIDNVVCANCSGNNLANMIIVGAVNRKKELARFSNRPGKNSCFKQPGARCKKVRNKDKLKYHFLVAPGVKIKSLRQGGGYRKLSGTSMAAPMVAGAAALLQSKWLFLKSEPKTTATILLKSAEDLGKKGVDRKYGRGLLRIDKAMKPKGQTRLVLDDNVDGESFNESSMALSPAFGAGQAIKGALDGVVVFDKYDRDFVVSPDSLVAETQSSFSLSRHFQNRYAVADRGQLVSGFVSEQVSFTGLVPYDVVEGARSATFSQRPAIKSSIVSYLHYMQGEDDGNAWRLDGEMGDLSFSFGQRLGTVQELTMGGSQDMFLFNSSLAEQPFLNLGEQSHYGYAHYKMSKSFGVGMGFSDTAFGNETLPGLGSSRALMVQADYAPTDKLGLQLSQTMLSEDDALLGGQSAGAFAFDSGAMTMATGVAVSYKLLASTTARLHFSQGMTDVDPAAHSLFTNVDTLHSQSYGLSLTRKGLFGRENDEFGISISRPLRVYAGDIALNVPAGRTIGGSVIYDQRHVSWAPEDSQTDFDLGYRAAFGDNFSLGANVFYQDNANDDPNEWNAGVLTQARLIF